MRRFFRCTLFWGIYRENRLIKCNCAITYYALRFLHQAKLVTFEKGDIIMRQGMEGSIFYVIESGEVEIMVKTAFEDPLTTPAGYLGAVINILGPYNYFGERALITSEPRAASIRALQKTRCFAFDVEDIPSSSVLSGKKQATAERMEEVNSKYGTDVYDIDMISDQFAAANTLNQQRGSVNNPQMIRGVDVDEDYVPPAEEVGSGRPGLGSEANDRVISLLVRFKQIRRAAKCFEYIMKARPKFGDAGESRRRALLVSKLTRAQREEFSDLFRIIDASGDGTISILELRRAMESVGEGRSDEELREIINNSNPNIDGNNVMNFEEFMGVIAEAEFYYLFLDTFEMLDVNNTGFVSAGDLDRVLCGVRDLISDDRMSIIDTEDMDMQVSCIYVLPSRHSCFFVDF
jgi:calmodulin